MLKKGLIRLILATAVMALTAVAWPTGVHAQTEVDSLATLAVDLWPDYDQEAVLTLLTGSLPDDTPLPATVTIPLHEGATLNAVARVTSGNVMIDDIEYTESADSVTLTTPDRRFRIEYYFPYEANVNARSFTFSWLADLDVAQLEVSVQQPSGANSIETSPAAISTTQGNVDNLTYHILPVASTTAGEAYTVVVNYTLATPGLSVELGPPAAVVTDTAVVPNQAQDTNWLLAAGIVAGVAVVAVLGWQFLGGRPQSRRPRKPKPTAKRPSRPRPTPTPTKAKATAGFCRECGQPLQQGDRFCRNCGTAVKR